MGCKYNLKEFQPFTSGKTKIIPAVTDDWKLVNKSFNTLNGVAMQSDKLDCIVYDLDFGSFLKFMKEENVIMRGDAIEGSYAIGTRRVLRKEADFNQTMLTKKARTATVIPKKDWKIGNTYETACGEVLTYIGFRYTQTFNYFYKKHEVKLNKMKKVYYAMTESNYINDVTNRKFIEWLPKSVLSEEECDKFVTKVVQPWNTYLVFSKEKPTEITFNSSGINGRQVVHITKEDDQYKVFCERWDKGWKINIDNPCKAFIESCEIDLKEDNSWSTKYHAHNYCQVNLGV